MEIVAFITLATGTKHKITQEEYNYIQEASPDTWIQIGQNTGFKKSAVMEIQDINEWADEKSFNYGQPYTALPAGIGLGGLITRETRFKALEIMAKGIKKTIDKRISMGLESPNAIKLLDMARQRYANVKSGLI